ELSEPYLAQVHYRHQRLRVTTIRKGGRGERSQAQRSHLPQLLRDLPRLGLLSAQSEAGTACYAHGTVGRCRLLLLDPNGTAGGGSHLPLQQLFPYRRQSGGDQGGEAGEEEAARRTRSPDAAASA